MPRHHMVNNIEVPFTEAEEAARNAEIAKVASDKAHYEVNERYKVNRRAAYPTIGDQLDAIWKQLNQDRLGGKELIQEVDDQLNKVLAVKEAHPKP